MTDFVITPSTLELNFQVVSPETVIQNTSLTTPLLKVIGPDGFEDCDYLITIHPSLYKEEKLSPELAPESSRRYRAFLRSIDASMCEFYNLLRDLFILLQPFEAPYPILPFLSPIVGVNFNLDVPDELARREVGNAIFLWKRKGTRDNIKDWIGFITGFRATIREYYKEVLRTNVYNQAYAVTPSTISNKGGTNYATLPHLSETHLTNTWAGNPSQLPFNLFNVGPNENYGTHGFTQHLGKQTGFYHKAKWAEGWDDFLPFPGTERRIESVVSGELTPGFLFRNYIGVFIDIPDSAIERNWFDKTFLEVVLDKLDRIFDLICFFGVEKNLVWRLVTEENAELCEQIQFTVTATFSEGWNDIEEFPQPFLQTDTVSCNGVEEEDVACIGDTTSLDIDGVCTESGGRLADFVLCTNNILKITNDAFNDTNGGPSLTWYYAKYWTKQAGRYPTTIPTLGTPGEKADGDILQTWTPTFGSTLSSEIVIPAEYSVAEQLIDPVIGTGTGQGREEIEDISQFVFDLCETGQFEDNVLNFVEEWNDPFQDTAILSDTWDVPGIFEDTIELSDDWDLPSTTDTEIHSDNWDITITFLDVIETSDNWDITTAFDENKELFDNWEFTVPLTITGPGFWLDGDNGPMGNSPINIWMDRFTDPTGNDAVQAISVNRPDHDPNDADFNDFGAVTFDGINDYMTMADDASINGDQFTMFVVFDWESPGFNDTLVSKSTDSSFSDGWGLLSRGSNTLRFYVDDINNNFVDTVIPNNTKTIVCLRYNQSKLEMVINGQLVGADLYGAGISNSAKDLVLGAHNLVSGFDGFFGGTIAEVIYYNRDLDNSEKITLLTYLGTKYDITIDTSTLIVSEDWDFAPDYDETNEVDEPFDLGNYIEVIEVDEDWDEANLPDIPVLEIFDDFEDDIAEVIENWNLVVSYNETEEVSDSFDFDESYLDVIEVDEEWEEDTGISDPGTFEYEEHWSADNRTLVFSEDWNGTTFVIDSTSFTFVEGWEIGVYVVDSSSFQFLETWNGDYTFDTGTFVFYDNWDGDYTFDSGTFIFSENWDVSYVIDSSGFQFFEDWNT